MKVQVSKIMAKTLSQKIKKYSISYVEMSIHQYELLVDCHSFKHEIDYNTKNGLMKAIEVVYPYEYYALPSYITTQDLSRCFKKSDGSLESFIEAFEREVAI